MRAGLESYAPNNLLISGTRLVLHKEVVLEQWKIRRNSKKSFAKVDKDYDLKDRVGIQMDKLYLIIIQDPTEEVASKESTSALEEGEKHHNLFVVGCRNIFSGGGAPLPYNLFEEKVIRNEVVDFVFIRDG
jgi:hypothetical protein